MACTSVALNQGTRPKEDFGIDSLGLLATKEYIADAACDSARTVLIADMVVESQR